MGLDNKSDGCCYCLILAKGFGCARCSSFITTCWSLHKMAKPEFPSDEQSEGKMDGAAWQRLFCVTYLTTPRTVVAILTGPASWLDASATRHGAPFPCRPGWPVNMRRAGQVFVTVPGKKRAGNSHEMKHVPLFNNLILLKSAVSWETRGGQHAHTHTHARKKQGVKVVMRTVTQVAN